MIEFSPDFDINSLNKENELLEQANIEKEETKQKFFKYLADHYEEWWD